MSFTENVNGFTPSFVSLALSGITHRFILVLECESRLNGELNSISHPRFCVGGQRATLDPRNVAITELMPLASSKVDLPPGWEKVHQLIYVVQQNTDEHGWQYRSAWPRFALETTDEPWLNRNNSRADVRRRLWMTTVVKRDEIIAAKRKISDLIHSRQRGVILSGLLSRLEENQFGAKSWNTRKCALLDEKVDIFHEETNAKVSEMNILGSQLKMLDGNAFSVRSMDGKQCTIFDTDTKESRRRWLVAITYQIAVRNYVMDFPPFPYAPPLGEDASSRTIICGDLQKKGQSGMNWKGRFFRLSPRELQYYEKETLKGTIKIDGAIVRSEISASLDFSVKSKSGVVMTLRAPTVEYKHIWVKTIEEQIQLIEQKCINAAMPFSLEDTALSMADYLIDIPSVVRGSPNELGGNPGIQKHTFTFKTSHRHTLLTYPMNNFYQPTHTFPSTLPTTDTFINFLLTPPSTPPQSTPTTTGTSSSGDASHPLMSSFLARSLHDDLPQVTPLTALSYI